MKTMITVTSIETEQKIYMMSSTITKFSHVNGRTVIFTADGTPELVKETPEELISMLFSTN